MLMKWRFAQIWTRFVIKFTATYWRLQLQKSVNWPIVNNKAMAGIVCFFQVFFFRFKTQDYSSLPPVWLEPTDFSVPLFCRCQWAHTNLLNCFAPKNGAESDHRDLIVLWIQWTPKINEQVDGFKCAVPLKLLNLLRSRLHDPSNEWPIFVFIGRPIHNHSEYTAILLLHFYTADRSRPLYHFTEQQTAVANCLPIIIFN